MSRENLCGGNRGCWWDAGGEPLGIAGIWEHRQDGPNGLPLLSFSMLTVNADDHPLMRRFHKPNDEKRMLVILRPDQYDEWLHCPVERAAGFFTRYPAERLVQHPGGAANHNRNRFLTFDRKRPAIPS
jgi:putative SOS response-associated peptidase YedK